MNNAKRYMSLKFFVENNGSEWAIFLCIFFITMLIDDKEATSLGIVFLAFPLWFFFREKTSNDIKLLPIPDKEIKVLNNKYRAIKLVEWIIFGLICFVLQRMGKTITLSVAFFLAFSILYWMYVFTKYVKREF